MKKISWVITISFLWLFTISVASGAAASTSTQLMSYEIFLGGMNALEAEFSLTYGKNNYAAHIQARTKGFVGGIMPWEGDYETQGQHLPGGLSVPVFFKSHASEKGKTTLIDYAFDTKGALNSLKIIESGKDKSPVPLNKNLAYGTVDVLTAALQVLEKMLSTGKCEGSADVFDGKKRYQLVFTPDGNEVLSGGGMNVYTGPAARCTIEVKPVAGKWPKKPKGWLSLQEQSRQRGSLPIMWIAQVTPGQPAVPVKIQAQTNYGMLLIHMTKHRVN